ncbi:MAG: hypothetical protein AAGI52_05065 [Bacteroidota bacterium]
MSSNPFAALFEDVDQASDPMLAEAQLSDVMFAPLSPPDPEVMQSPPANGASPVPPQQQGPVRETIAPIRRTKQTTAMPAGTAPVPAGAKTVQAALVVMIEKRGEPDLNELNDLLASGWRVVRTESFPSMDNGGKTAMLIVVEQLAPK